MKKIIGISIKNVAAPGQRPSARVTFSMAYLNVRKEYPMFCPTSP